MKSLKLISNDIELFHKFNNIKLFDVSIDSNILSSENFDIIIISDRLINVNSLIEYLDNKNIKNIFYMLSNENNINVNTLKTLLENKGVTIIPPKLTDKQIIEKVCNDTVDDISIVNNVAVFFGADTKVGTTMSTQCIAEALAKCIEENVCLIFLNGSPSNNYYNDNNYSLDSIKVKLINNVLTISELLDNCIKHDNLFILSGVESILEARHYHPETIEKLINLAAQHFSTVIIDAGSNINLGMTIGAINSTKNKYLITTQQNSSFNSYQRIVKQIFPKLGYNTKDFLIIVNKFINSNELDRPSQIANSYNSTLVGYLPYIEYGWQSEKEKKSFLNYNVNEFNIHLNEICKILSSQLGINYIPPTIEKKGMFGGVTLKWRK